MAKYKKARSLTIKKLGPGVHNGQCVRITSTMHGAFREVEKYTVGSGGTFEPIESKGIGLKNRTFSVDVCPVGAGMPSMQLIRPGRRGGIRAAERAKGGILACQAAGQDSKCLRSRYASLILYPGGAGWAKRKGIQVFGRYHKRRRRRRR